MHELVTRIKEPELCYVFARNARRRGHPELAVQAYRRAVDLRADRAGPRSEAERAAARAIFAYEEALSHIKGKRTRATGTWQMVNRHGLLGAVRRRLESAADEPVRQALGELGMEDYSFSSVRASFPEAFEEMAA